MGKPLLAQEKIERIVALRKSGHSLPEICDLIRCGKATIWKYIREVEVPAPYDIILKAKQGGSKARSQKHWILARERARSLLLNQDTYEVALVLACLYWGEGNKTEFNLINSDPALVETALTCLRKLKIPDEQIKISIRIYEDIDKKKSADFWLKILSLSRDKIVKFDVLKGKKAGKLRYGMCRLRVAKGAEHFKLVMSVIDLMKEKYAAVVQRIERGTPKP